MMNIITTVGQAFAAVVAVIVFIWACDTGGKREPEPYHIEDVYIHIVNASTYAVSLRDTGEELFRGSFVECSDWIVQNTIQ